MSLLSFHAGLPCIPNTGLCSTITVCTLQGHCGACRKRWHLTQTRICVLWQDPDNVVIVDSCPLTKFGGLTLQMMQSSGLLTLEGEPTYEKKKVGLF